MIDTSGRRLLLDVALPESGAGPDAFVAFAIGDIDTDEAVSAYDIWTIDQNRRLDNLVNDCAF